MSLGRVGKRHLSAHEGTQCSVLKSRSQRCVNACQFVIRGVEERHGPDIPVTAHQIARSNLHLTAAADNNNTAAFREQRKVMTEVHIREHFQDDVHSATRRQI